MNAVARTMPPAVMGLGTALPRHGLGSYFGEGVALWDDPQPRRGDAAAAAPADRPRWWSATGCSATPRPTSGPMPLQS